MRLRREKRRAEDQLKGRNCDESEAAEANRQARIRKETRRKFEYEVFRSRYIGSEYS